MLSACIALSFHLIPGDWNEVHPCVRYEHGNMAATAYLNSEGDLSLAASHVWRWPGYFFEAGLVSGYEAFPVVPFARAGVEKGPTRYFVAPALTTDGDVGLVLGVEFRLGR